MGLRAGSGSVWGCDRIVQFCGIGYVRDPIDRLDRRIAMNTDSNSSKYHEIAHVVGEIKECIDDHKDYLGDGEGAEARTRTFLINRLLGSLGWDVLDPSRVQLEYRTGKRGRVDYVLQTASEPRVIVEAKSLGIKQKQKALDQLYDYMDDELLLTVNVGVLTDGDEWHIYRRGRRKDANTIKVTTTDQNLEVAMFLHDHLGRSNFPQDEVPTTVGNGGGPVGPPPPGDWIGLDREEFVPTKRKPSRLKMYDGTEEDVSSWQEMMLKIAVKLVDDGKLTKTKCPIPTGENNKTSVVNTEPRHHGDAKSGRNNWEPIGKGMWVWNSNHATGILKRTRTLLAECDVKVSEVQFQLRQD